jgi:uncharacterized membrane protein
MLGFILIVAALIALTVLRPPKGKDTYHSHDGMPVGGPSRARTSLALAVVFAFIAMFTIGTKGFLYKVGVSEGAPPATFALVQSLTFLPIAIAYAYLSDKSLSVDRLTWSHAPYNGILTALASVLLLMALIGGDASTAVPISQLCFVVTAVLAVLLFQERLTSLKVIGIGAAVAAVLVLSTTLTPF